MANEEYKVELSVLKAVKYPVFGVIATWVLKILGIAIAGFNVQMPDMVEKLSTNPQLFMGLAVMIFVYDWLKHKVEAPLP